MSGRTLQQKAENGQNRRFCKKAEFAKKCSKSGIAGRNQPHKPSCTQNKTHVAGTPLGGDQLTVISLNPAGQLSFQREGHQDPPGGPKETPLGGPPKGLQGSKMTSWGVGDPPKRSFGPQGSKMTPLGGWNPPKGVQGGTPIRGTLLGLPEGSKNPPEGVWDP